MNASVQALPVLRGVRLTDTQYFASGGFADVFRGRWVRESGELLVVAVKLARRRNPNDKHALERTRKKFLREAQLWAQLRHHNVVPFYGLIFEQGLPGIVMPYYGNGDLVYYLQRSPRADRLKLIRNIAWGLEYLHGFEPNPVVHGDIKASNIMITDAGEACLTDFGLAKVLCVPGYTTASLGGNCRWMSPEILEEDDFSPTTSSDVWAFGMTILEIHTGKVPFDHIRRDATVIRKVCNGHLPIQPYQISDTIWALLQHCWDAEPRKRPTVSTLSVVLSTITSQSSARENWGNLMGHADTPSINS